MQKFWTTIHVPPGIRRSLINNYVRQYVMHCHKAFKDVQATFLCTTFSVQKNKEKLIYSLHRFMYPDVFIGHHNTYFETKIKSLLKKDTWSFTQIQEGHWLKRFRNADFTSSAKNIVLQLAIHIQFQLELTNVQHDYCYKYLVCITAKVYFTWLRVL